MEITHSWIFMFMVLCIRNTEAAPLGATKRANSVKEDQRVALSLEKETLLETKSISGHRGESVTLPVVFIKESEIQDIQWVKNGINFATTKPNKDVTIRDSNYNGRLSSSSDGSLVIQKITIEDQGEYKADIFMLNAKKYEIVYQLHIPEEPESEGRSTVAVVVSIIVVLLVVGAAGAAFMMWKKKKMCFQDPRDATAEMTRHEPEGKSEAEKEALQKKESNPNLHNPHDETTDDDDDDNSEFVLAREPEEEMSNDRTSNIQVTIFEGNNSLPEHSDSSTVYLSQKLDEVQHAQSYDT